MVFREGNVPTLKVGLEQWNFTTVGVAEISPMNWAYYPCCEIRDRHKSPPRAERWKGGGRRLTAVAVENADAVLRH